MEPVSPIFTPPQGEKGKNVEENLSNKKKVDFLGEVFYIDEHYEITNLIGKGTYGMVAKGINKITGKEVAIKKMSNLFKDLQDAKRILREVRILKFFKSKNVIQLIDIMSIQDEEQFNEVYLVFEFMTSNLAHVIQKVKLSKVQIRVMIYQLLSGLYYMHSANIIHRDIKPQNLLVNKKCQLKIGDLNLATKWEEQNSSNTEYVSTRWYRAPEVLVGCSNYNNSIDVWSAGCVLAELVDKSPLFKGQDYLDQISRIAALLGIPTEKDFQFEKQSTAAYNLNILLNRIKGQQWNGVKWIEHFKDIDPLCADLLDHMLVYNPRNRFSVEQCMKHPYLKDIYQKSPPEKCEQIIDWTFDNLQYSQKEMRIMFLQQIEGFKKDLFKKQSLKREMQAITEKPQEPSLKRTKKESSISIQSQKQAQKPIEK